MNELRHSCAVKSVVIVIFYCGKEFRLAREAKRYESGTAKLCCVKLVECDGSYDRARKADRHSYVGCGIGCIALTADNSLIPAREGVGVGSVGFLGRRFCRSHDRITEVIDARAEHPSVRVLKYYGIINVLYGIGCGIGCVAPTSRYRVIPAVKGVLIYVIRCPIGRGGERNCVAEEIFFPTYYPAVVINENYLVFRGIGYSVYRISIIRDVGFNEIILRIEPCAKRYCIALIYVDVIIVERGEVLPVGALGKRKSLARNLNTRCYVEIALSAGIGWVGFSVAVGDIVVNASVNDEVVKLTVHKRRVAEDIYVEIFRIGIVPSAVAVLK